MSDLIQKKCRPCEGGTKSLNENQIQSFLQQTAGWEYRESVILRTFQFKNYYETTAFVNAVVWIAHREDHHPDISFGYKKCEVRYSTHAVKGITENDFICAAKINALLPG